MIIATEDAGDRRNKLHGARKKMLQRAKRAGLLIKLNASTSRVLFFCFFGP